MPALTMRGRYLMREYWEDSDLFLRMTAEEREVYVGLWMLADDAGWMPRDVPAISAALFRYVDRAPREAHLSAVLDRLRDLKKVESLRCCLHIPAVERWPRSGRKTFEHRDAHLESHSKRPDRIRSVSNPSPVPSSPVPSLPPADARPPEGGAARSYDELMAANGIKPEIVGRRAS